MLNIIGDQSMLQITVDRLSKLKSTSEIYIITRKDLYEPIVKNIKNINPENVIIEPSAKNTAPAIGLVSEKIYTKNKNAIMGVFPADHLIVGHKNFEKSMDDAFSLVKEKDHLVTIGIKPTYPSTAYGYIQYEPDKKNKVGYHVKTFAEKPHEKLAKRFISSGDFLWNAGIFVWNVRSLLSALEKYMPELHDSLSDIRKRMESSKPYDDIWESITPESIDYGVMEKADNIFVIPADFEWNDNKFIPFDFGYFSFIYDSSKINNPPNSFEELAERNDLSIIIMDPRFSTPGLGLAKWINQIYGKKFS